MVSSNDKNSKLDKMDLAYAAILGLAVVITAWCGYQHELWSSALTFELKQANTAHREFTTTQLKEGQSTVIDAIAFTGYLDAVSNYDFFTSMYASVSFLEGIGRVFASRKMQGLFLVMGAMVFSGTTIVMFAVMPIYPGNFSL